MGKDDELFDDQIDDEDDLLNFDLDDLTTEDGDEDFVDDEEGIIELTDRVDNKNEGSGPGDSLVDDEDANVTAEIIRVKKDSRQVDELAETLTDLDISVLSEEKESITEDSGGLKEISEEVDMSEEDFNKIFEEDDSNGEMESQFESEDSLGDLISEIKLDDNTAEGNASEDDILTEEDFDDRDLAKILEDESTGEMELERLQGIDDSLLEVIEKAKEDELTETITNLHVDDKTAVIDLGEEGGYTEETEESYEPESPESNDVISETESPPEIIPGISESQIEEIITKVLKDTVERVVRETVAEVAEKVISESIEALKQSIEIHSDSS